MESYIFILVLVAVSSSACGASEVIPFKVTERTYLFKNTSSGPNVQLNGPVPTQMKETESIVNISAAKIVLAVEEARNGVCNVLKKGHVKMWFKTTAKGQFIVAETSGEAGLEVQFDCVESEPKSGS